MMLQKLEVLHQQMLRFHPVARAQWRKVWPPGLLRCGINCRRTGTAKTTADIVWTDDKKSLAIDGFARPYVMVPPAGFAIAIMPASRVVTAAQGMAN